MDSKGFSFANGNGISESGGTTAAGKSQRDSGWDIRPANHWWLLI